MADEQDYIIEVKQLRKVFGDRAVLDGVSVKIPAGKTTVIMGGSGCGKSTILRHLIGLLVPTSGEIWIDGQSIVGLGEKEMNLVRRKFGMLFQSAALFN